MTEFIDLNSYDGETDITADVCIAGAGAAGITLARELAKKKLSVVLLESGGEKLEGKTQFLYQGSQTGIRYFDLSSCRLRYFGGTTNHWGGFTNHNTELDHEGNAELGIPGWQLSLDELKPWLKKAAAHLEVEFDNYDPDNHVSAAGLDPSILIEKKQDTFNTISFLRTQKRRFNEVWGEDIKADPNIRLFLHANVTQVQTTPDGHEVDHYVARSLDGKEIKVRAKRYVLACHAIENARLLLLSDDVHKAGIGNRFDMVGRYFMDHIHIEDGEMVADKNAMPSLYYRDSRDPEGNKYVDVVAQVNPETRKREKMLSYYIRFHVEYEDEDTFQSLRYLRRSMKHPFEERVASAASDVMGDLFTAGRLMQEQAGMKPRKIEHFRLDHRIDQAPNPHSRVTLTDDTDALGLRKINLHWDLTELDVHSFNRGQELALKELAALGLGRVTPKTYDMDFVRENVIGHYHNLGTTRMGASAADGVVDGDCRVHDVPNLFVAGSSTWPNCGASGPTMTIVAMAMRMGDKIATELGA